MIIPLFIKIYRSRAIHRHKYNESTKMELPSNKTTYKKNYDVIRLYKPPSLDEMKVTGESYFSLHNDCSEKIIRHLGYCFLYLLTQVNKPFYKLLTRSLENEPFIFGYRHNKMINSEFLERLYEEDKALLNEHKATCHRGDIPLCSMIICCTEWPDIDPRRLHLLSLVDSESCSTFAFRTCFCGNITGFDHRSFEDPLFKYSEYNCNYIPYEVLKWREPTSKDQNELQDSRFSYFNFSFKEDNRYLRAKMMCLNKRHMCVNILPGSLCSTNPPTNLSLMSNTLEISENEFSVILTIDRCEELTYL
jgi:hypothetical protein